MMKKLGRRVNRKDVTLRWAEPGEPGDHLTKPYIEVQGLRSLVSAFREIDKTLVVEINQTLRGLAQDVRSRAREFALSEGFGPPGTSGRGTGALIRNLKYSVRAGSAAIRETAVSKRGTLYPAIYEFGHSAKWGHRPFIIPALKSEEHHIYQSLEQMLDSLLRVSEDTAHLARYRPTHAGGERPVGQVIRSGDIVF